MSKKKKASIEELPSSVPQQTQPTMSLYMGVKDMEEAFASCSYTSQAEAMGRMLMRENVFISGPPGSGKSAVVQKFIETMGSTFGDKVKIAVTATTGFAASSLRGSTIHSWSGVGIGYEMPKGGPKGHIKETDILIVDEISMLPAYYLDLVDAVCKKAKKNSEPFGGIQVIFLGDFNQLPPVPSREAKDLGLDDGFCINSDSWVDANISYCYLDKLQRTSDPLLMRILQDMENSQVSQETVDILKKRKVGYTQEDTSKTYTKLYTVNKKVDKINEEELAKNTGTPVSFRFSASMMFGATDDEFIEALKNIKYPEVSTFKIGAKVMITKNGTYVEKNTKKSVFVSNGSIGVVTNITKSWGMDGVEVKLNSGKTVTITTVSETLERKVLMKTSDAVSLGLVAKNKDEGASKDEDQNNPKDDGMIVVDKPIANIVYIPLKLAYAITVHKSQGQTLDGVYADLSQCFTPGLGYVALSRVRRLDDLIVESINKKTFMMDSSSLAISRHLKNEALRNREKCMDNVGAFSEILENSAARHSLWKNKG